jgi:8-oxo-dGTP diphosphatase
MAGKTIHAAGGIVVRGRAQRLVAVVQRSKDELWVLPRGKLKRDENPLAGARREAVEETGHRVRVREFVGAISYRARNRPKVVQFWRMQAEVNPSRDLTKDIAAVEWLTLAAAVRRLSYPLEKLFLRNVGRHVLKRRKRTARRKSRAPAAKAKPRHLRLTGKTRASNAKTAASRTATRARPTVLQRMLAR